MTGFLGRYLAQGLLRAGAHVVGIARRPERGADLAADGVELRSADLLDPVALGSAVRGVDAIVSNASVAVGQPARGSVRTHAEREVRAIGNLVDALVDTGQRRFVHISSVAVYRDVPVFRVGRETDPLRGMQRNVASWFFSRGYGEAKAAVEHMLQKRELDLTSIRPGPIYGAGDDKLLGAWARWVSGRVAFVPDVAVPFVHAADVAQGVVAALAEPSAIGRAYNLTGPSIRLGEAVHTLRKVTSRRGLVLRIPMPVGVHWDNTAARADLGVSFRSIEAGLVESFRPRARVRSTIDPSF